MNYNRELYGFCFHFFKGIVRIFVGIENNFITVDWISDEKRFNLPGTLLDVDTKGILINDRIKIRHILRTLYNNWRHLKLQTKLISNEWTKITENFETKKWKKQELFINQEFQMFTEIFFAV